MNETRQPDDLQANPADAPKGSLMTNQGAGIAQGDHRAYVGGRWDEIGLLQFRFLCKRGMRCDHHLFDIGCGSLRLGVHAIPYLEPGHYLGVDRSEDLIRAGVEQELLPKLMEAKRPFLRVSGDFAFRGLLATPDIAWAHSLFTHLPLPDIRRCLANLRGVIKTGGPDGVFYATIFESTSPRSNPTTAHDQRGFFYTQDEMRAVGEATGWGMEYLGEWDHPRGQRMLQFSPTPG